MWANNSLQPTPPAAARLSSGPLDAERQKQALSEALRVAHKLIICESVAPLPRNKGGFLIWLAETLFGYEHKPHFKRFLAQGGIKGLLDTSDLPARIEHSQVFWYGAREVTIVSRTEHDESIGVGGRYSGVVAG